MSLLCLFITMEWCVGQKWPKMSNEHCILYLNLVDKRVSLVFRFCHCLQNFHRWKDFRLFASLPKIWARSKIWAISVRTKMAHVNAKIFKLDSRIGFEAKSQFYHLWTLPRSEIWIRSEHQAMLFQVKIAVVSAKIIQFGTEIRFC